MQRVGGLADQGLIDTIVMLRDSGLNPGTISTVHLSAFRRAADPLFGLLARPTAYIHKKRQQELLPQQSLLLSIYGDLLRAIRVR